eukprot:XP_001701196.1 predicted protein [Chlamydomonas reinhardtii]
MNLSSYVPTVAMPRPSYPLILITATGVLAAWLGSKALRRIQYVGKNEQVLVKRLTEKVVVNGPTVFFPNPLTTLSYSKRKAINLSALQYVKVDDSQTGETRVVAGPALVFLGPYEAAQESVSRVIEPITLTKKEYVKLQDKLSGRVWIECGPGQLFLQPHVVAVTPKAAAYSLQSHQYIRLQDTLTGVVRVERGEQLVFPGPFEVALDGGVAACVDLQAWEYCVVQDRTSGKIRVERGEKLVWLSGSERVVGREKEQAVKVDSENAVLVLNQKTGLQTLVEAPQLFFPSEDEVVVEVRKRIKLADNEAVILKDAEGKYHYRYGDPAKNDQGAGEGAARSFFLPPYWELVSLMWSRGRRREHRDLRITTFDMRAQYMSFEFNCRTSDNVEMILEGTFFWDVCAHARSCFIQLVSKVTLQTFMDTFNDIARAAHSNDDNFYSQERATGEVLDIQHQHAQATARAEGAAEAERCDALRRSGVLPAGGRDGRDTAEEFWKLLRKNEALTAVAQGSAHVYFTPQDAHLTIENRS